MKINKKLIVVISMITFMAFTFVNADNPDDFEPLTEEYWIHHFLRVYYENIRLSAENRELQANLTYYKDKWENRNYCGGGASVPVIAPVLTNIKNPETLEENSDMNGDGVVDEIDLAILRKYYGNNDCSQDNEWCHGADINHDGEVDGVDLANLGTYYTGGTQ